MKGAQWIVSALARRGVKIIFSLSGNQIMPLYDACIDAGIRIVHVRHEAAAVYMADAWSQITGEVGVAMLTAGPGITNGISPLFSAVQAESPVLLVSGDAAVAEDGMGAFQEMDQTAITAPLTKLSLRPESARSLMDCVDLAMDTALAPRRGPVHLALPFDWLGKELGVDVLPERTEIKFTPPLQLQTLRQLSDLLDSAQNPLALAGPSFARVSVRAACEDLQQRLQLPLFAMESPRGLKDPSAGNLAQVIRKADLVILAGKRLDFTLGFGKTNTFDETTRFVVVDPDPAMLERARRLLGERLALAVQADALAALQQLAQCANAPAREEWLAATDQAIASRGLQANPPSSSRMNSKELCETVQAYLSSLPNPILICDGGEFGQWAQAYCTAPRRIINGVSGAIGGGICYAIAAQLACPDATVVALMGDGTSGFHLMELDTAAREAAPIIAVIGNDVRWNAEHLIQVRSYGADRLIGCELSPEAQYDQVAVALGGSGGSASTVLEMAAQLKVAGQSGKPCCINARIDGLAAPVFATGELLSAGAH